MHTNTLEDVQEAIQRGEKRSFQPMKVYITGFAAQNEFPVKFFYRGCTTRKQDGFQCRKTMEGPRQCREHLTTAWENMFRFDVYVSDSTLSPTSPPVRVTLSEAAATLLGIEYAAFGAMDNFNQYVFVHAETQKSVMVDVHLKYNPKDKFAIAQRMCGLPMIPIDEDCSIINSHPGPSTPRPGPSTPLTHPGPLTTSGTPRSAIFPPADSSSSTSQKKELTDLLLELFESLGHTKLSNRY